MLASVSLLLSVVSSCAKAMLWFSDLHKQSRGNVRALVEELKENSRLCFRVIEDNVPPEAVIPRFSTVVFDRLNESGFDFNTVKRSAIPDFEGLSGSDLAPWAGKPTKLLIASIYDKIKDLRSIHALNAKEPRLWRRRIINIHKRLLLLLRHAST